MSDGITEARRGTYWNSEKYNHNDSIHNPELYGKIKNTKDFKHMPNQKWHKIISFIKSGVRIIGYGLIPFSLVTATLVLIFSEIIGIVEELV
jgi:hypothetical protein